LPTLKRPRADIDCDVAARMCRGAVDLAELPKRYLFGASGNSPQMSRTMAHSNCEVPHVRDGHLGHWIRSDWKSALSSTWTARVLARAGVRPVSCREGRRSDGSGCFLACRGISISQSGSFADGCWLGNGCGAPCIGYSPAGLARVRQPDGAMNVLLVHNNGSYGRRVANELSKRRFAVQSFADSRALLGALGAGIEADIIVAVAGDASKMTGVEFLAAVVFVTTKPVDAFLRGQWESGFKFLPMSYDSKFQD